MRRSDVGRNAKPFFAASEQILDTCSVAPKNGEFCEPISAGVIGIAQTPYGKGDSQYRSQTQPA